MFKKSRDTIIMMAAICVLGAIAARQDKLTYY